MGWGVILKLKVSRFYGLFDVVWMLEPNGFMFVKGLRGTLLDGFKIVTLLCVMAYLNNMQCEEQHVNVCY